MKVAKIDVLKTMSSQEIAELTGKENKNVMADIRAMCEELGILTADFSATRKVRGREYEIFNLPKRETLILVSGYSVVLRAKIVDRWQELEIQESERQNAAIERAESRAYSRLEFKPMTDAIVISREEQGKSVSSHHFSNEADLINRIALGMSASKFRQANDIEAGEPIRDRMTAMQIKAVLALQRANTAYLEEGVEFKERQQRLQTLYDRRYKSAMIEETIYLNA
jgi:phage regulator Rha-like protein